ncbi:unnamed protein product [Lymnaea stagnalis]|uniref:Uncharacterized protein n=1 Tax=Lymnaea stagnalis TaxID=6523 RepID=A0AAV2ILS8_LYMST
MKPSELLFLAIAILHSPHERNCVKIMLDGFEPKTPNSRNCKSNVYTTGRIILDEGETLENLPQSIIIQFKCPYFTQKGVLHAKGRQDGLWTWPLEGQLKECAYPESTQRYWNCTHSEGRTYRFITWKNPFFATKYCRMRLFLAKVIEDHIGRKLTKEFGLMGLSRELSFTEFIEAPYYDTKYDDWCNQAVPPQVFESRNGASYIRPATDILLMICGVTMANTVLSF